jgi:hypothetical protein
MEALGIKERDYGYRPHDIEPCGCRLLVNLRLDRRNAI